MFAFLGWKNTFQVYDILSRSLAVNPLAKEIQRTKWEVWGEKNTGWAHSNLREPLILKKSKSVMQLLDVLFRIL